MNYLIVGKAKTGTTAFSKIIANSIPGSIYHLEPKGLDYFECKKHDMGKTHVVKIIYEHWQSKPRSRNALVHNELSIKFHKRIFIVRDPRDEIISRLLYLVYPWAMSGAYQAEKFAQWVELLKMKESNPASVSFFEMVDAVRLIFGADLVTQLKGNIRAYYEFINAAPSGSYVARYEEFVAGNRAGLENYLGLTFPEKIELDDLERTKRSASFNNWKEFFLLEDVRRFKEELGPAIDLYGYEDWDISTPSKLDPSNYSDYVSSLINKCEKTPNDKLINVS
jgi:hypothetical protein